MQPRKGRLSLCFSSFAYFPVGHNTHHTAQPMASKQASNSAGVRARSPSAPAEGSLRGTDPSSACRPTNYSSSLGRSSPCSNQGQHSNTQGWNTSPKESPQPNKYTSFTAKTCKVQKIIRHFKWGFEIECVISCKIESTKLYRN